MQLFCIVPAFLMLLGKDTGEVQLVFRSVAFCTSLSMIYWEEIHSSAQDNYFYTVYVLDNIFLLYKNRAYR